MMSAGSLEGSGMSLAVTGRKCASELALVDMTPQVRGARRRPQLRPMSAPSIDAPRGPYGEIELPGLLYSLFRDGFSGRLHLRRGRVAAVIPFSKGRPCSVDGPDSDVGLRLFDSGRVTDEEYAEALEIAAEAKIGQGDAAVRMGRLTHEALRRFLRRDVQISLLQFARLPGEYGVVFDPEAASGGSVLEVSPFALVFACVSLTSPAALVHHFDEAGSRHVRRTENARKYQSAIDGYPTAGPVLEQVKDARTVGRILAHSPVGLVETLRVLRALEYLDCVSLGDVLEESEPLADDENIARRLVQTSRPPSGSRPPSTAPRPRRRRTSAPLPKVDQIDVADLVRRTHHRLSKLNYYELLEIDPQALGEDIQAAYRARVQLFSRDTVERLDDPELVEMSRAVTERLFAAIQVLRDRGRRAAYDAVYLEVLPDETSGIDVVAAEDAFHRGRAALEESQPAKALEYFERAAVRDEHAAEYRVWRGWARFQTGLACEDEAAMIAGHDEIKAALLDDGTQDEGFVLLANCYEQTGRREAAIRFYRTALGINRRNADARNGLRRLERAGPRPRRKSGGFFDLVKR